MTRRARVVWVVQWVVWMAVKSQLQGQACSQLGMPDELQVQSVCCRLLAAGMAMLQLTVAAA